MTFELGNRVKIKKNGVIGDIVEITKWENGTVVYTVESSKKGHRDDADYPSLFPLYDCKEDEIEKA